MKTFEFVKIGETIRDGDPKQPWKPTTNIGNKCNHAKTYRRIKGSDYMEKFAKLLFN